MIRDHHAKDVGRFLRFMYNGGVEFIDMEQTIEVMSLAHKYNVKPLFEICGRLIAQD